MKIAPLLAQYFYTSKKLDIPGIGSLYLDGPVTPVSDNTKEAVIEGVRFENNKATKESPELVNYIARQTGNIRALCAADLESYWEQARQFLHIGKPFLLEGIGSLQKLQGGGYTYTAGVPIHEKMMDHVNKDVNDEEASTDYKTILYLKKIKGGAWKKPLAIFLFVAGLGAAIWGGYELSKRNTSTAPQEESRVLPEQPSPSDTVQQAKTNLPALDSAMDRKPDTMASSFKFIVETARKERALQRYSFLRKNNIAVQMETKDSLQFNLFFLLPAATADTARIRDSLKRFYTPVGKKAYVEK